MDSNTDIQTYNGVIQTSTNLTPFSIFQSGVSLSITLSAMAVLIIFTASFKSHKKIVKSTNDILDLGVHTVDGYTAAILPVAATAMLVLLYYLSENARDCLVKWMVRLLMVTSVSSNAVCFTYMFGLLSKVMGVTMPRYGVSKTTLPPGLTADINWDDTDVKNPDHFMEYLRENDIDYVSPVTTTKSLVFVWGPDHVFAIAAAGYFSYKFSTVGDMLSSNVVAALSALCMLLQVELGSIKWLAALLSAFFVYDVYFVFASDIMVTVATTIDIPVKLALPHTGLDHQSILGLGDIVLPGLYMLLCNRFGRLYFYVSLVGYIAAMALCLVVLFKYNTGQPALFYIVPILLGLTSLYSYLRGEFQQFWQFSVVLPPYDPERLYSSSKTIGKKGEEVDSLDDDYSLDSYDEWEFKVEDLRDQATDVDSEADREDLYNFIDDDDDQTFIIENDDSDKDLSDLEQDIDEEEILILIADSKKQVTYWYDE